jgi:hypothetical protein
MIMVVTYQHGYLGYAIELCDRCFDRGDHEHGTIGPVLHTYHLGLCEGAHHEGEGRSMLADLALKRAQQA